MQGGRDMNPADAFRKVQRQKEIQRNKRERQFQRDASKLKSEKRYRKHFEITHMIREEVEVFCALAQTAATIKLTHVHQCNRDAGHFLR